MNSRYFRFWWCEIDVQSILDWSVNCFLFICLFVVATVLVAAKILTFGVVQIKPIADDLADLLNEGVQK
mgnify:CR=1 FL=1